MHRIDSNEMSMVIYGLHVANNSRLFIDPCCEEHALLRTFSTLRSARLFRPQVGGIARAIGGAFYRGRWTWRFIDIEKDVDFGLPQEDGELYGKAIWEPRRSRAIRTPRPSTTA